MHWVSVVWATVGSVVCTLVGRMTSPGFSNCLGCMFGCRPIVLMQSRNFSCMPASIQLSLDDKKKKKKRIEDPGSTLSS